MTTFTMKYARVAGHEQDCICVPCMMADLDEHLASQGVDPRDYDSLADGKATGQRTRYARPGQRSGRGIVRKVSAKQVAFMRHLFATRDTSRMIRLRGSEDLENMSLAGARDLIDRLLACPELPAHKQPSPEPASDAQKGFIQSLLSQRDWQAPVDLDTITKRDASALIGQLKEAPYKPRESKTVHNTTLGMYLLPDGTIVRTQKARGKDHVYGMVLDRESGDAWIYTRGIIRRCTDEYRMTLAEVEALSLQLGSCCCCGTTLTATVNGVGPAARVIGPICAVKYGYAA